MFQVMWMVGRGTGVTRLSLMSQFVIAVMEVLLT